MQVWKPWSVVVVLAALFSAACEATPAAHRSPPQAPSQAEAQEPEAALPSFLDILLQDEAVLVAHHARFEPPVDVEMVGETGTVKYVNLGGRNSLGTVAVMRVPEPGCGDAWNRIMGALRARLGEGAERSVVEGPSTFRQASWGARGRQLRVFCFPPEGDEAGAQASRLSVARIYPRPSRPEPEPAAAPPKRASSSPPSYFELLLDHDASAFLRWDEERLDGGTVDLAGLPGRVTVEWSGGTGDSVWVTVRPEPAALTGCEPLWDRIVGQVSERLGTPMLPGGRLRRRRRGPSSSGPSGRG